MYLKVRSANAVNDKVKTVFKNVVLILYFVLIVYTSVELSMIICEEVYEKIIMFSGFESHPF